MQAEVPTGKRHWSHQSSEDSAIAPLAKAGDGPVAMKDTVLDAAGARHAETATHVPETSDEPDRTGCRGSPAVSGSPLPSPVATRASPRGRPGYETPPPSPEDPRTPVSTSATASLQGAPYADEIPPPLPITDVPTDVVVVNENELLLQKTAQNPHQPAHLHNDEQSGGAEEPPSPAFPNNGQQQPPAPAGCDNAAFTPDGHAFDGAEPEKPHIQRNGIAKPVESGCTNPGFEVDENTEISSPKTLEEMEGPVEALPYASASPSAAAAAAVTCSSPEPSVENTLPGAVPEGAEESRKGRRVSFSESPPQRAVYEAAASAAAASAAATAAPAPLDPAARAIKEQGLGRGEKWRILRNVVLISAAFMLAFTAFFGAANLQSSVNADQGLGTVSLTAAYAALIVSNLFLPSIVIRWLGCKWAVAGCMLLFTPYAAAQLCASWATLVPTALLLGAVGAPMWCAKCSYLNAAAGAYAAVTGAPRDLVMVRFFGLFYVLFPLGHLWGNLLTSEVLSTNTESAMTMASNATLSIDVAAVCGANFCPTTRSAEDNPNLARPPDEQIRTIGILFIVLTLIAVLLVAVGVDNLRRYGEGLEEPAAGGGEAGEAGAAPAGGGALLVATVRLLADRNQLLLLPVTAFIGISQAFLGADFTESYIACAWGIPYIGYVLMGYGLASSVASVAVSWAVKRAGRLPVVTASICLFLALVAVMRWWTPRPGQGAVYALLATLWGVADCTQLIINAMYGLLFRGREAAAYSNFSLWYSVGFVVTYSYSPHLCAATKLALLAVVLLLSLAGFVTAELALRRILAAEQEAQDRQEALAGAGVSVLRDKAHAA